MENLAQPMNGAFPGGKHNPPVSGGSHAMPWIWLRQVRDSAFPPGKGSQGAEGMRAMGASSTAAFGHSASW